jgi:hypothetical protein
LIERLIFNVRRIVGQVGRNNFNLVRGRTERILCNKRKESQLVLIEQSLRLNECELGAGVARFGGGNVERGQGSNFNLFPIITQKLRGEIDGMLRYADVLNGENEFPVRGFDLCNRGQNLLLEGEVGNFF